MTRIIGGIALTGLFATSVICAQKTQQARIAPSIRLLAKQEVLYLPGGEGLRFMSFGYRNLLSKLLWFKTISYFGKHFGSDRNYDWLSHMCGLVVQLDPQAAHVYKFCSMMLAWEAGQPERGQEVLTAAIKQFPDSWEFYYYRGILGYLFLNDQEQTESDLSRSASLPGASVVVRRLAAKKLAIRDPNTAIEFLKSMIEDSENAAEREALDQRLREAVYERDARTVEQAIKLYQHRTGQPVHTLQQLVDAGYVSHLTDPYGGHFMLDAQTGLVRSSTGKARLQGAFSKKPEHLLKKWNSVDVGTAGH